MRASSGSVTQQDYQIYLGIAARLADDLGSTPGGSTKFDGAQWLLYSPK